MIRNIGKNGREIDLETIVLDAAILDGINERRSIYEKQSSLDDHGGGGCGNYDRAEHYGD